MGVIVLVYFNKIISLPVPLLYYVFDLSVLLHKIPNICRFIFFIKKKSRDIRDDGLSQWKTRKLFLNFKFA